MFMQNASAVIVTSEYERNQISKNFRISFNNITIIPVGVDTNKFKPLQLKSDQKSNPNLLYVGRIIKEKGLYEVVKCIRNLKLDFSQIHLDIVGPVGDSVYFKEINDFIRKYNIGYHVTYHGTKTNDELPEIYNMADLFVFPSLFKEGNPAVVMESMACGTPVVALKDTRGANEVIVNNENGNLTNLENLTSSVKSILKNTYSLKQFSEKSRKRICDHYSFENTFQKHKELYTNILNDQYSSTT